MWVELEGDPVLLVRCARALIGALVRLGCAQGVVSATPERKVGHSSEMECWIEHEEAAEGRENVI